MFLPLPLHILSEGIGKGFHGALLPYDGMSVAARGIRLHSAPQKTFESAIAEMHRGF